VETQSDVPEDDDEGPIECKHDWEIEDESFDHAFGTEVRVFAVCSKCDAEIPMPSDGRGWYFDHVDEEWVQGPR
jgi:hypothetical protein